MDGATVAAPNNSKSAGRNCKHILLKHFFPVNCIKTKLQGQASFCFGLFEKENLKRHNSDLLLWKLLNKVVLFNQKIHSKNKKEK